MKTGNVGEREWGNILEMKSMNKEQRNGEGKTAGYEIEVRGMGWAQLIINPHCTFKSCHSASCW